MNEVMITYPPENNGERTNLGHPHCRHNRNHELYGKIIYTRITDWNTFANPEVMGRIVWPDFVYGARNHDAHLVELFKTGNKGSNEYAILKDNQYWIPNSWTTYMIGDMVRFTKPSFGDSPKDAKLAKSPAWQGVILDSKADHNWHRIFQVAWADGSISWETPKYLESRDEEGVP